MGPRLFRRVNVDRFPTSNYRYSFPAHFSVASILLFECRESIYRAAGNFTCVARPDPWNWTVWFRSKRWTTTAFMRKCAVLEAPGYLTYERSRTFDLVRYRGRWTQLRDAISMMQNKHECVYVIIDEKKYISKKNYIWVKIQRVYNQNSVNTQKSQVRYKFISV